MIDWFLRRFFPQTHVKDNWPFVTFVYVAGSTIPDRIDVYVKGRYTMSYDWIDGEDARKDSFLAKLHLLFRLQSKRA